jgi:hypothetical protein
MPMGKKRKGARGKKQRRKGNRISQGPLREFRQLQGPFCKVKFPIDLKP